MYEREKEAVIAEMNQELSKTDVWTERQSIMKRYYNLLRQYETPTVDNNLSVYPPNLPAAELNRRLPCSCKEQPHQDEAPPSTS